MLPDRLLEWNRTEVDYPRNSTVADLFGQQAALTPDAIAVVHKNMELSYREIDLRSNRLAQHLQSLGVKPETLVGVFMERSETLVISLLAILKAGGAYVPLDVTHPQERLSLVIEDSEMPVLLTAGEAGERLPISLNRLVVLNVDGLAMDELSPRAVTSAAAGNNLAYVIYTSGSTGRPKGVMVEHRKGVSFFTGMDRAIGC